MRKDLVFKHYCNMIDNLIDTDEMFPFLFQNPRDFCEEFYNENYCFMPHNVSLTFGATRFCIVDENYPFVVKVEYSDHEESFDTGFCEREIFFYEKAREENFDRYFTEVQFLGYYRRMVLAYKLETVLNYYNEDGLYEDEKFRKALSAMEEDNVEKEMVEIALPLYGYERADTFCTRSLNRREEDYYRTLSPSSPLSERDTSIAARFIEDYGEEEFFDFSEFLERYEIGDIHGGNVGVINDRIVIFDYASFPYDEY